MNININADDFGMNIECTNAIFEAFEHNLITTTTMMCNQPAFEYAVQKVLNTKWKDKIGIHFVLTEGVPLTDKMRNCQLFCDSNGIFHNNFNRYSRLTKCEKEIIHDELCAQAERFKTSGLEFHHADSHHHIHTSPAIFPIVLKVMREYDIQKVRIHRNIGEIPMKKKMMNIVFNSYIKSKGLNYSEYFGSYNDICNIPIIDYMNLEVMCHPDFDDHHILIDRVGGYGTDGKAKGHSLVELNNMLNMKLIGKKE